MDKEGKNTRRQEKKESIKKVEMLLLCHYSFSGHISWKTLTASVVSAGPELSQLIRRLRIATGSLERLTTAIT